MTNACVVAYLPTQFAVVAPIAPDGTYTIANVPSGTYALAFLGCSGGDPQPTVTDTQTNVVYNGVWWNGVPLQFDQHSDGGPDPIAQHANLVTVTPGQNLTGYDWCFGCTAIRDRRSHAAGDVHRGRLRDAGARGELVELAGWRVGPGHARLHGHLHVDDRWRLRFGDGPELPGDGDRSHAGRDVHLPGHRVRRIAHRGVIGGV